ncbi:MAG: hypothetical protein LDL33_09355 [Desulfomonile sp.]|nr:hypothetical protein [Desulfomonile sp.]
MRTLSIVCLGAAALLFASSCATLRVGSPVKATYKADKSAPNPAADPLEPDEGWAVRYIPGLRALSRALPEPTEGRKKFDREMNRKYRQWTDETSRE